MICFFFAKAYYIITLSLSSFFFPPSPTKKSQPRNPLIIKTGFLPFWTIDFQSGDGGSRTLVQTRNPHVFYMLIPLLVFVPRKGTNALNATLSPKFRPAVGAPTRLSRNCLAPRAQAGIRNLHLRDVSSTHLVGGLSQ